MISAFREVAGACLILAGGFGLSFLVAWAIGTLAKEPPRRPPADRRTSAVRRVPMDRDAA